MNAARLRTALLVSFSGAALAVSLTGCQSGTGVSSEKAGGDAGAGAASASASAPAGGSGAGKETASTTAAAARKAAPVASAGTGAGGGAHTPGSTGVSGGKGAGAGTAVCAAKDVKVTFERQDGPPYTHIILTARNISGHRCRMAGFPHVRFLPGRQQDVPSVAKSKPLVPTVLSPGDPAFVLVKLSDGGLHEDNQAVSSFSVQLEGDSTAITVGSSAGGGLAVDPAKTLTGYWTTELRNGADDF